MCGRHDLIFAAPNQSQARLIEILTYQEMLTKSDVVVIATPKSKTTDTGEQAFFPNIVQQDKEGRQSKVESIGVETVFVISTVLKGDDTIKQFTLHHYRERNGGVMVNGPMLFFLTRQTQAIAIRICFFLSANQMADLPQQVARPIPATKPSTSYDSTDWLFHPALAFELMDL